MTKPHSAETGRHEVWKRKPSAELMGIPEGKEYWDRHQKRLAKADLLYKTRDKSPNPEAADRLIASKVQDEHNDYVRTHIEHVVLSNKRIKQLENLLGKARFSEPKIQEFFRSRIDLLRKTAQWLKHHSSEPWKSGKTYIGMAGGNVEKDSSGTKHIENGFLKTDIVTLHKDLDLEGLPPMLSSLVLNPPNGPNQAAQKAFVSAYREVLQQTINLDPLREYVYEHNNMNSTYESKEKAYGALKMLGAIGVGVYALFSILGDIGNKRISSTTIASLVALGFIFRKRGGDVEMLGESTFESILRNNKITPAIVQMIFHLEKKQVQSIRKEISIAINGMEPKKPGQLHTRVLQQNKIPPPLIAKLQLMKPKDARELLRRFADSSVRGDSESAKTARRAILQHVRNIET